MSEFEGYVSLEIFLSYGLYTGADLDDLLLSEKESDEYVCLDAYSVFGKIARLPGRAGSGDIALSTVLAAQDPTDVKSVNRLAEDLSRFFDKKIQPFLAARRDPASPDVAIPVDIELRDAGQNTVLLLTLDADEECFSDLVCKLESLCTKARQNCLKEMSVYRDEKGKWKITGCAERDDGAED